MKKKIISMVAVVTFGLMAAVWLVARSGGGSAGQPSADCCGEIGASCDTQVSPSAAPATGSNTDTVAQPVLMQPVQAVFDNYLKVQAALSRDSFQDALMAATAMAKAIQGDSMKMLPSQVAKQTEALANAKDIKKARDAFKPLSQSLVQYLEAQKVPAGTYHEVYCPMANASWLQTGKTVANPYLGAAMLHCGQFKS